MEHLRRSGIRSGLAFKTGDSPSPMSKLVRASTAPYGSWCLLRTLLLSVALIQFAETPIRRKRLPPSSISGDHFLSFNHDGGSSQNAVPSILARAELMSDRTSKRGGGTSSASEKDSLSASFWQRTGANGMTLRSRTSRPLGFRDTWDSNHAAGLTARR